MRRIDFYLQHLLRHRAQAVELQSGQPVVFRFADSERKSSTPLEHQQLLQLVHEAAPEAVLREIDSRGTASFAYRSAEGDEVDVEVQRTTASSWRVVLTPRPSAEPSRTAADPAPQALVAQPTSALAPPAGLSAAAAVPSTASGEPRVQTLLRSMQQMGASDLHLSSGCVPMVRLHGDIQPLPSTTPLSDAALKQLLFEIMPERNRDEFEAKSDTDFAYAIAGLARFRANAFRDRHGIGAVFRVIPFQILSPEVLGIPKRVLDLCWLTKGLVVVTGPTGSGKSTTLATLIDVINRQRADHIITIEDPIEFVHDNKRCLINQREVGTHTGSFKHALRAALREDPDVILVGEMRDLETIAIAIETAETGHLVFGTLHTTTAPSTVDRIIDQFPSDRQAQIRVMLSESLRGVIAQVLCKKQGGGRIAAYEVLLTNPAVSNLIREGKTFQLHSVMQTGKKVGMQTLNDHLLEHVQSSLVSPQEAYVKCVNKTHMREALEKLGHKLQLDSSAS